MAGSQQEDYLLRQVRIVAAMLARILGLRTSGKAEEARAELENAYGQLLGPQTELLRCMDSQTAAALLGSPDRILALAQLTDEEAAQETDARRSADFRLRALELGIEAMQRHKGNEAIRDFLKKVASGVDWQQLAPQQRASLEASLAPGPGEEHEP